MMVVFKVLRVIVPNKVINSKVKGPLMLKTKGLLVIRCLTPKLKVVIMERPILEAHNMDGIMLPHI